MDLLLCSLSVQVSVRRGANLVVTPEGQTAHFHTVGVYEMFGPVAIYVGIDWRVFGRHEAIRSCGEVNDLIVWFLGEGLPSVDLAHGDLP